MSKEYLDSIHNNTSLIRANVEWLTSLSQSFRATGNEYVAKELEACAKDLYTAQKEIQSAVAKDLNRQCAESRQLAASTLNLAVKHLMEDKE